MEPEPEVPNVQDQDHLAKLNYFTSKLETIGEVMRVDVDEFMKNVQVRRKKHRNADYFIKNTIKQAHQILDRAMSNFEELFSDIKQCEDELEWQPVPSSLLLPSAEDKDPEDPTNGVLISTTTTTPIETETNKDNFLQEKKNNEMNNFDGNLSISKEEFKEYPSLNENDLEVVDDEVPTSSRSINDTGGGCKDKDKDKDKRDVLRIFESINSEPSANKTILQNQSQIKNSKPENENKPDAIHPPLKKLKLPPPPLITRPFQQQQLANNVQNIMNLDETRRQIIQTYHRPRPRSPNSGPSGPTGIHWKPKPPPMVSRPKLVE